MKQTKRSLTNFWHDVVPESVWLFLLVCNRFAKRSARHFFAQNPCQKDVRHLLALIIFFFAACGPSVSVPSSTPDTSISAHTQTKELLLRMIVIDVGQGDAIVLITPQKEAILIDSGNTLLGGTRVLNVLHQEEIQLLSRILVTHYHEDHIGGIAEIVRQYQPSDGYFDRGRDDLPITASYKTYENIAKEKRTALVSGDQFTFGESSFHVFVEETDSDDENSRSLTFLVTIGDHRLFLSGDITGGGGNPPFQTLDLETALGSEIGDIDILKVAHHGSHTSTNTDFLAHTTPEIALISVGNDNEYFHPHPSVIDRLIASGIEVYQTEKGFADRSDVHIANGNIVIDFFQHDYEISIQKSE